MKLNAKHKRFCQEYVIDLNATQAAIRAGYSKRTARSQGQRLLTKVDIQKNISVLKNEISEKLEYDLEASIRRDLKLIEKYEKALDVLENPKSKPKDVEAARRTVKFIGPSGFNSAQDRLSKQHGFFEKDNDQKTAPAFIMYDARKQNNLSINNNQSNEN